MLLLIDQQWRSKVLGHLTQYDWNETVSLPTSPQNDVVFEHPVHFILSWKLIAYHNIVSGEGRAITGILTVVQITAEYKH